MSSTLKKLLIVTFLVVCVVAVGVVYAISNGEGSAGDSEGSYFTVERGVLEIQITETGDYKITRSTHH